MTELPSSRFSPLKMVEQVFVIYSGVNGYLDPLPVERVRAFEDGLLGTLRSRYTDLLGTIRDLRHRPRHRRQAQGRRRMHAKTFA